MEIMLDGLSVAGDALLAMALNPFYYIGLLLIALMFRRQTELERKLFFVRLHGMLSGFWRALLWGWAAGLVISLLSSGFGFVLTFETLLWVWAITLLLLLARIRYASFAYAAGVIAIMQLIAQPFEQQLRAMDPVERFADSLLAVHLPSLFALAAIVHAAEALLIRIQGSKTAVPLYVEGKRGKVIGAYELHGMWALPLFLVVPAQAGDAVMNGFPWPMFFGGGLWNAGWTLLAFPVLIGCSGWSTAELPERRVKRISGMLLVFAVLTGVMAVLAELWPYAVIMGAAALLMIGLHEGYVVYADRRERGRSPGFVLDGNGLKVLGVLSGSPAAEMGIVRGETIIKANGITVSSKEELHAALRSNSAFCKLEVMNVDGHNKFVQRALFYGEHHQLGLVLGPDDHVVHYIEWRALTLLSLLGIRWKRRSPGAYDSASAPAADSAMPAVQPEQSQEHSSINE